MMDTNDASLNVCFPLSTFICPSVLDMNPRIYGQTAHFLSIFPEKISISVLQHLSGPSFLFPSFSVRPFVF